VVGFAGRVCCFCGYFAGTCGFWVFFVFFRELCGVWGWYNADFCWFWWRIIGYGGFSRWLGICDCSFLFVLFVVFVSLFRGVFVGVLVCLLILCELVTRLFASLTFGFTAIFGSVCYVCLC